MAQSKLTSELQCPVCLGLFSDPVTLPCDHTFCRGCLESYLATDVAVHLCPQCRAPIPRRDYRTNRVLRNMADRARQEEEKVSEQTDLLCVEHDEKLKLYCETDGTLICLVCRDSSSHRGHGFKPVQEAAREFRESLLAAQKAVKEDVAARESLRDRQQEHIASRKENHRALKTQLSAQFEELRQMLMKKEEEEEQYMDEKETLKLRPMERNLEAIERELRESREKAKAIKTGLDTTETHRFLEWWCKGGYSTANREKTAFSSDRSGSLCVIPDSLTVSPAESLEKHIDWRGLQSSIRRDIRKAGPAQGQTAALTLVLLGRRGSGKSSAGNTILGRKEFKTSLTSRAVTTECQRAETQIHGRPVAVIDTPDFFDQACPDPGAQIQRCLDLSAPGPHVFLLVLQLGRFSQGEKKILTQIQQKFGPGVTRHIVVLFTHGDDLEGVTEEEFLKNSQKDLRELIRECGGRYQVFNNKTASAGHPQVPQLLQKINRLVEQNRGELYHLTALDRGERESQAEGMELGMTQEDIRKQAEELQRWNRQKKSNSSSGAGPAQGQTAALTLVLLGRRGSGKSSAGNTILGRKEFKTSLTSRAVTTECQRAETQIDGRPVAVIDTPDFFDQACPDPGAQSQRCLDLSAPGAHVFLLVLQLGRFSDGEKEMVRQIKEKLGSGSLIMVLFTHGDELRNQTIQQFLLNSDPELRKLVRQCGGWFHLFDNTVEGDRSQVTSLLEEIDIMSAVYGEDQFSREMLLRTINQFMADQKGSGHGRCNIM